MSAQPTVRADLHNHTTFSPDSILSPRDVVRRAKEIGIDWVAITDHNTVRGGLVVREIADGFRVIVGEEIKSAEGEILGLFLEENVPRGLPARESIARIRDQGGIVGVPHPFDSLRSALAEPALTALAGDIDFV